VKSTIIRVQADQNQGHTEVDDAEFPVASADGKWLAYLRSNKARSTIWLRALFDPARADVSILPPQFDVEEMTFLPDGSLIFAATKDDGPSLLYVAGHGAAIRPLTANNARYPAASPDGRWLAYSKLDRGVWNLWLRDLRNGTARRITDVDCNDISPAWQTDSKTLIYASDCGRALWFTALYQRQVIP
jgi:Tol biopolymer transport system component